MKFPFDLSDDKEFDVLGFGTNAVDYLITVPEYPAFNSKIEIDYYTEAAGGEIASTMAGLKRLGMKTAYAGRFGSDRAGEIGLASLVDEGVDISFSETIDGAKTQIAFIMIDAASGERTILWQRDKLLAYDERDAPVDATTRCRVLHMTPHDTQACIRMAAEAKANGAIVSVDIDNVFEGIKDLLPLVDICIASAEFSHKLLGTTDLEQGLRELNSRFGCAVTGATVGDRGSVVLCDGRLIETPAFAVPGGCIDTTGAGDAFRTGLLYGLLSGEPVEESCRMANAVAALKCRGAGARCALPTETQLQTLLKKV
ncbi:MAG: carbohydrate kinase family protein [Chloracidobacterium sp.]|nr:carbohydrate kinase family protein [Chloracidobacterium sp.]